MQVGIPGTTQVPATTGSKGWEKKYILLARMVIYVSVRFNTTKWMAGKFKFGINQALIITYK